MHDPGHMFGTLERRGGRIQPRVAIVVGVQGACCTKCLLSVNGVKRRAHERPHSTGFISSVCRLL